ncbi:MAG: nucleotide exchange factor GrpE [Acidimicrobiia bacterium]|nr:nucleotide exchange factor GrpE [Acidimicrobiia bacterium]
MSDDALNPDPEVGIEDLLDADADAEAAAAEVVEGDLERLLGERNEMRALAQQIQADFENYRKQAMKREAAIVERASEALLEKLLPVLDSFDSALAQLPPEGDESVRKGLELVHAQLVGVLEAAGLERIEADGVAFDPNEHEAVMHEDGDGDPVVAATMRSGYRVRGRVVRPAMVKVTK